jgi:drug/metabolite transporter (DMT)-like permease
VPAHDRPTRSVLAAALATLYLVWGSTYLAIAVLVETVPPLTAVGVRFLLAGSLLGLFLAVRRRRRPLVLRRAEIATAAGIGVLTLFAAFSLLFVGETRVQSGPAALLIASVPLWIVAVRLIVRERVERATIVATAAGFAGVAALLLPGAHMSAPVVSILLVMAAALSEAIGSFAAQRVRLPEDPLVSATVQMLFAGALALGTALAVGERVDFGDIPAKSLVALAYLVVPGSVLAYTTFVWLLQHASASTATTYAYVNPIIALFLGWAFLGEAMGVLTLVSAGLIIGAVAVVISRETGTASRPPSGGARRRNVPTRGSERGAAHDRRLRGVPESARGFRHTRRSTATRRAGP